MNERASTADGGHNVTAARVPPAAYARWKQTGIDARAVFLAGLDAVTGHGPAAPASTATAPGVLAITLDGPALALAERITAAIERAAAGRARIEHEQRPAPDPAAVLAALADEHGPGAHVTRDQVMSLLGCGQKRARSELAALVGAGLATADERRHPHPQTWTLTAPAPTAGTSPPADG